jgi:O-antigen/teichoic acid export membrane protein
MRQSIGLIILQFISILVGLISTFWVAGNLPANVFAVVGVNEIIISFIRVFSNIGIETLAIRNVLNWKEEGNNNKIIEVVSQSIYFRGIIATILVIPAIGYAYYISTVKFNNEYLYLFLLMAILSVFNAINDSAALLLRSFNKYFSSALVNYSVSIFGRFFALIIFINFGFKPFIYTIIFLPLIITIPVIFMLREWLSLKSFYKKDILLHNLRVSKHFTLSAYLGYIFSYLDQLVISIVFPAEILGSFSIGKRIVNIAKSFIGNIFDPMIQELVKFKNDINRIKERLRNIFQIKNFILIISILSFPAVYLFSENLIDSLNLTLYPYLIHFIIIIYISQIVLIELKIKYVFISLFYESLYYLKMTFYSALSSILFFIFILIINVKFIFFYQGLTFIVMIIYTNYIYAKLNGINVLINSTTTN